MYCPNCGIKQSPNGPFCSNCGQAMTAAHSPNKNSSMKETAASYEPFALHKKGKLLNILIILFGSIPIIPLLLFLATIGIGSDIITTVRLALSGLGFILAIFSVIFNAIYYLPTLICYSNWKPIILLLNFFISWTILGWFLLLLIAHMSNKSYAERQKLRHDMNQTAKTVNES